MRNIMINSCPICGLGYIGTAVILENEKIRINCERCGSFEIAKEYETLKERPWSEVRHLVSAWIKRENKAKIMYPDPTHGAGFGNVNSPEWWATQYQYLGFPETTSEKLNALLVAYGDYTKGDYNADVKPAYSIVSEIGAKDIEEVSGLSGLLVQAGYLAPSKRSGDTFYKIGVQGWLRIEELKKAKISSNLVFVAMWFSDITLNYRNTVVAAVEYCGYKPIIVDQQEYNDFIMNQVVSLIKQSRFLIADFTSRPEFEKDGYVKNGVRGGVYWEAGMAYGLGKTVIHTCEDNLDSRNRIHFDVGQYNTIFWKEEELKTEIRPLDQSTSNPNFTEKLVARILATIGKGG